MIHYSQFAARRASRLPLLGAIASLAAVAIWLGDPQVGAATATAARVPVANRPMIGVPLRLNDHRSLRLANQSDPPQIATLPPSSGGLPQAAVALFNRDRAAAGLPSLNESLTLDAIASTRAQQMVTDGLTHMRPGRTVMAVTELLHQNGVTYMWNGENIFWSGGPPFDDAISSADVWWMNSPEHRDNILGAHFRQVGIGTAIDSGKMYISAVFTD
ncbi:MAG TPA: CAP domain-containing protein [Candidatus Dormibacteraeota bacterium]|nr:CAP domain-containing protein [Candidatus Dormibacteraeota bacterium]